MQFLVVAMDGTDAAAPARRAAVRAEHLVGARGLAADEVLVLGGALLDPEGGMIGSAMIIEADSEEAARALLAADVYSRSDVWQDVQIWPFRRAV